MKTSSRIKVLMLIDAWFPHIGGGQVHALEIAKRLNNQGFLIEIFTRDLGEWFNTTNIDVTRVGQIKQFNNIAGRLDYLFKASLHSLTHNYDLIHAHAFSPGLIIPLTRFFNKSPIVFTVHGKGDKIAGLNLKGGFLEEIIFYKIPYDLQITVAKNTLSKKSAAKRLKVIPNGIDLEKFKKAIRLRKKINKLLYVGRLSQEKGVDLLIDAFRLLNSSRLQLVIVGEGQELGNLKNKAKGLNIKFTGKLLNDSLIQEFKKADLFVLPSRTEGQPLALFESWGSKLPIVITKVGDNSLYVKDEVNGFLADPTKESLKESINRALIANNLLEIVENGYSKVQKYTWDRIAKKTAQAYKEVLNETS